MRLYAVALITWAAFITASSEHNIAKSDKKAVDYTDFHDVPTKQIVQPYVTDVEAKSSGRTGTEDHSDDFANVGLSRSAVHAGEERGSNDVSTADSSSPGSIYATPLDETSIRLETTDKYPFREYPSHESGYTEDVFFVENAGSFGQKVRQNHPGDETIVRTVVRTSEYASLRKPFGSTASPLENEDNHGKPYVSATREPFVFALKEESNLDAVTGPSSDDSKIPRSETSAERPEKIFNEITTENSPPGDVTLILENDVVPEFLPTPQARSSRGRNNTADEKITEKSVESTKKSENIVRTSTTVEFSPSFQARFSGPIIVADLPDRETQEMVVDYMDDGSEVYKPIENTKITPMTNADRSKMATAAITSSIMLNPLQVGITLVNADQARLTDDSVQSAAMDIEDYQQDDLQRLATIDKEFVKDNGNQSHIEYQDENFQRDEGERDVQVDIQKIPDDTVEIQKSIELFHTAPVQEIHYPPEYIQQTANLGVIETNNIGSWQRTKQAYDQVEQSELRPTYDIYQGNDQDERSVIKAHESALSPKFNRHEYNALEDDVGRPAATVSTEYSSGTYQQTPAELQPFKYNGVQHVLLAPNQFDDTLYEQSNVRHNFNGNDNGIPPRVKPVASSARQEAASEQPAKPYVPSTYQYSVQQPQSNQPYHQQQYHLPETRRPEVPQLLLKIIPEGSSANGGFLVPIPRPYPIEKIIEKKIPTERPVEKKVAPAPQAYPVHVVEKQIRLPHIYPLHIERVIEKRVPYTFQRLIVQPLPPPSYPLHVRLPATYSAYPVTPIDQPVPIIEKATEKPAVSSRPSRPVENGGATETRFTKYYQKPQETIFPSANFHGIAGGGLTFLPQPTSEKNASQFYSVPYGRPAAYDYNVDVGKNFIPTAHFSNIKLVILPKKFSSHMILRPQTTAPSYTVPSFGRHQVIYKIVEKDKSVKDEYVGPAPPRKISHNNVFLQTKPPQFTANVAQSLASLRKVRQPETQHHGSFRQSKMEYGFKPPMVPSIQYDENTSSKVEN